jgi:hypothetical protein
MRTFNAETRDSRGNRLILICDLLNGCQRGNISADFAR